MKRFICCVFAILAAATVSAEARTVAVSLSRIEGFRTAVRDAVVAEAKALGDVDILVDDADGDQARQFESLQAFIQKKVDAIIVIPVDGDQGVAMSKLATDAGIPLIFVNNEPINIDALPEKQAYVGSDERDSGTLQAVEICRILGGKGRIAVMTGELLHGAARQRTRDIMDVVSTDDCSGLSIVEQQSANWSQEQGAELMAEWLSADAALDAVIANNDSMALGAVQALKKAGLPAGKPLIAGIDAMPDALAAVKSGDMTITVLQSAEGQGREALNAALKLAAGETLPRKIFVPFELVTAKNVDSYLEKK